MANEKRLDLIDRRQLLKELRKELRECRADGEEMGGESILWAEGIEFAIDTVKQTKKADAVEVVHGRWIHGTTMHRDWMKCSECLHSQIPDGTFVYCPNCGAKMDGERREGE